MELTWKGNLLGNFKVKENQTLVGHLYDKNWMGDVALGEVGNEKYSFVKKSIFSNEVLITAQLQGKPVGRILYNVWNSKATIYIDGLTYTWRYENFLYTKWCVENTDGDKIRFESNFLSGGKISANGNDSLQILIGLYVYRYFQISMYFVLFITLFTLKTLF
ncbi:MAG: hypothetical protein Q4G08_08510 [Capnocytophaga sp.]|nr:hypothetical protein [Capnocytophaga sp.]